MCGLRASAKLKRSFSHTVQYGYTQAHGASVRAQLGALVVVERFFECCFTRLEENHRYDDEILVILVSSELQNAFGALSGHFPPP